MAIEGIAVAAVGKELVGSAAIEAAKQVAQKAAAEIASKCVEMQGVNPAAKGVEMQNANLELQTMQDGFRVGEMTQPGSDELLASRAEQEVNCKEIKQEMGDAPGEVEERNQESVADGVGNEIKPEDLEYLGEDKISYEIHTRNEGLEGYSHPITGVPFESKTITDAEGNEVTGVFPVFDSRFDAKIPSDLYEASDKRQFSECNQQLAESIEKDPEAGDRFSPEQLEQIKAGDTPDGYTWHHNEEPGKMQLVDFDVHAGTGHTGGRAIWGGGTEFRS